MNIVDKINKYLNEDYDQARIYQLEDFGSTGTLTFTVNYKLKNYTFEADTREQAIQIAQDWVSKITYSQVIVNWGN